MSETKLEKLKEEIRKIECQPFINNILKKRDIMKGQIGKVYSTHALSREVIRKREKSSSAMLILSVAKITGLKYGTIEWGEVYDEELIYRLDSDGLRDIKVYYQYDLIEITLNNTMEGNKVQYLQGKVTKNIRWKYEQKPELFENLKNKVRFTIDSLLETSIKDLNSPVEMWGNFNELDSNSRIDSLKSLGYRVVELTPTEYSYISNWHPFAYDNLGILATEDSCKLIENKIKEYNRKIAKTSDFTFAGEYISAYKLTEIDRRTVSILEDIVKKIKKS